MWRQSFSIIISLCLLLGCAADPIRPGGNDILLSKEAAPGGCEFLDEVQGAQGNFWTANFTSDANLIKGARNNLRNAALALRANYVKIETESFSHNTSDDSLGGTYSAVVIGNAYRCPDKVLAVR